MFSLEERVNLIKKSINNLNNVKVISFKSMLIDVLKNENCNIIIRGIRNGNDFIYEEQMEKANKFLMPNLETIFLSASSEVSFISSTIVKSILTHNGDIKNLVPEIILNDIKKKWYSQYDSNVRPTP